MGDALGRLYADHEALGGRLDELEAVRQSDAEPTERLDALSAALREEIEVHSRKEEAVLFPALAARGFAPDLLRGLAADHEALRKALLAFSRARAAAGDWRRPAGHIVAMLRTHMR